VHLPLANDSLYHPSPSHRTTIARSNIKNSRNVSCNPNDQTNNNLSSQDDWGIYEFLTLILKEFHIYKAEAKTANPSSRKLSRTSSTIPVIVTSAPEPAAVVQEPKVGVELKVEPPKEEQKPVDESTKEEEQEEKGIKKVEEEEEKTQEAEPKQESPIPSDSDTEPDAEKEHSSPERNDEAQQPQIEITVTQASSSQNLVLCSGFGSYESAASKSFVNFMESRRSSAFSIDSRRSSMLSLPYSLSRDSVSSMETEAPVLYGGKLSNQNVIPKIMQLLTYF
jgi:hypothetical protein